jgi:drug/metabolite transporter (DMT)-like permease
MHHPLARTVVIMTVATFFGALGDTHLAKGMKQIGDVTVRLKALPRLVRQVAGCPSILTGVGFLTTFFVLWLAVLSWADFSVALPMTSLSYVFGALLARFYLHERVNPMRWGGTILVCAGVALVVSSL